MIVTVANSKGGTGKTTTAVNVSFALAGEGQRVIVADLDAQGHVARSLGLDSAPGVYTWLTTDVLVSSLVQPRPELDYYLLLPGDSKTRTVEIMYASSPTGADTLRERLVDLADITDWVIFDTPPGGILQEMAIAVADVLVQPVHLEQLGMEGAVATLALARKLNPHQSCILLPTAYDKRLGEHQYNLDVLRRLADPDANISVAAPIPNRVAVPESTSYGLSIYEHTGRGANDVRMAYDELLLRLIAGEAHHGETD